MINAQLENYHRKYSCEITELKELLMGYKIDLEENQIEANSTTVVEIRRLSAIQLIRQLYNVQFIELSSREISNEICEKYRLHATQYYFNEKILDMMWQNLEEDNIYHISDGFLVHFIIFRVNSIPYMFGPFCTVELTESEARRILRHCDLQDVDAKNFLNYRGTFPLIKETEASNIIFSFINHTCPDNNERTIRRITSEIYTQDGDILDETQHVNYGIMLEQRYAFEKQFMEAIITGNTWSAINNLHNLDQNVSYLKRIGNAVESERIGAAITRTTVRIAAAQAGLPSLIIDKLSTENTVEIKNATNTGEILLAKDKMVRNFCKAIRKIRDNKYSARVQSILYYINHDYASPISFLDLSHDLNISENRLISSFKKEVGTTPNAYLTKIRMEKAAELLVGGRMTVGDVSHKIGISDSNYFVKLFKKEFGMTPTDYRKRRSI